jgi:hypothetical protein
MGLYLASVSATLGSAAGIGKTSVHPGLYHILFVFGFLIYATPGQNSAPIPVS